MRREFSFETDCAGLTSDRVPALHEMIESATRITYQTMRRHCVDLLDWARGVGFNRHVPLSTDPFVGFFKSTFEGRPCYYLVWSAYECIWTP